MTKWALVRAAFIVVGVVLALWQGPTSNHATPSIDGKALILAFVFGVLGLQFLLAFQALNKKSSAVWRRPSWKENPFSLRQPVQFFHLAGWFFVVPPFVTVALTWLNKPEYILDALMPFCVGIGILCGVQLSKVIYRKKYKPV
jgi:drug/metabolite transporter (DMT)-like permease